MGRAGVDIYPLQVGVGLADVTLFGKYLGGSPTNVAVAAARYRPALGSDHPDRGRPVRRVHPPRAAGYGVDDRFVTPVATLPTPVTFCEIFPPDNFPLYFYRFPKAPDLEIWADELDYAAIGAAGVFWATVTGLSQEPSRAATLAALASRARRHPTVLDLDYRPMFWKSPQQARRWARKAIALATVIVGNLDECEVAVGSREPARIAAALLAMGAELAIVKLGPEGVLASRPARRSAGAAGDAWMS